VPPSGPELGERVVLGPMLPWLPVPATALVGRESDVALIGELLQPANGRERPLTLVGPGGVGKTRLALAVAAVVGPSFQDGAVFVHLASLRDPRLVPATIARALAPREAAGRSIEDALSEHLRDRQMLLVLDNFEHLSGAAWLLAEMIQACPRLALLVTSRAVLRLRSERRFSVEPLAAPAEDVDPTVAGGTRPVGWRVWSANTATCAPRCSGR